MAASEETTKTSNGDLEIETTAGTGETLYGVLCEFVDGVASPESAAAAPPVIQRVRDSFGKAAPRLREASSNTARDLVLWTRDGSPLRALLVISVGTIALLALTGLLVFTLFFLAATTNAIIISFLMSLAAAGGFLALFFACLTVIYIGALFVATFVITTTTISVIIAVTIITGLLGLFWIIWLAAKKSMDLTKQSLTMTSSAISAYSSGWQDQRDVSSKSYD